MMSSRYCDITVIIIIVAVITPGEGSLVNERLYDDLLRNYNRLIRPVGNTTDKLTVKIGMRLTSILDIDERNQIMTTNVWLKQQWQDYKLSWNPSLYENISQLSVPAQIIWLPDIVLYNNADGDYHITLMTKATAHSDGLVVWEPPAIYKSFCEIDVQYFPYDRQQCKMKFGSWTYDGYELDLVHEASSFTGGELLGIDLSEYHSSVEWHILEVVATRNEKYYPCCTEPYPDVTFSIVLRRKTLFYTVNLIIPCVGISFLTVLVFYLPSDSKGKITLCITIIKSLTVFFLLLSETIPQTSDGIPLIGKFLLFTMILVTLSTCITVGILNVHFRSTHTRRVPSWVRKIFLGWLPKFLLLGHHPPPSSRPGALKPHWMETPTPPVDECEEELENLTGTDPDLELEDFTQRDDVSGRGSSCSPYSSLKRKRRQGSTAATPFSGGGAVDHTGLGAPSEGGVVSFEPIEPIVVAGCSTGVLPMADKKFDLRKYSMCAGVGGCKSYPDHLRKALRGMAFIERHMRTDDTYKVIKEDWKYLAMVLDRLFLWLFTFASLAGTITIVLNAPSLYDNRVPLDLTISSR